MKAKILMLVISFGILLAVLIILFKGR